MGQSTTNIDNGNLFLVSNLIGLHIPIETNLTANAYWYLFHSYSNMNASRVTLLTCMHVHHNII